MSGAKCDGTGRNPGPSRDRIVFNFAAYNRLSLTTPGVCLLTSTRAIAQKNRPPLRVIFINRYFSPDISATSQMLSDLCFALAPRGFEIVVVASRMAYDSPETELPARELCRGVDVHRVWTTRFGRSTLAGRACDYLAFYCSAFLALMMIVRRGDVVVAKTDPPLISVVAAAVARLKGARLINWLQDLFPEVALRLGVVRTGAVVGLLRKLRNWSLRVANVNVAIGSRMAKLLVEEGATPQSIAVIHNWADPALITPTPRADNALRQAWALTDRFVVGYSGNLGRAHEFDTMLGAAEILAADPSISFLFIGGGHGNGQLREATATRGLSNVQFRPYQPQSMLAQSLAVPDVHLVSLLPAMEGLIVPSKIYGIAAAGRPCIFIGDASGELADLLKQGGFGLVVTPGDSQALADAIRKLQADPAQLQVQMSSARQYFEDHHTTEHSVARWEALLRALANKD